jgi:hypothetical protein
MIRTIMRCFRLAPRKSAATSGGGAVATVAVPKVLTGFVPAIVMKTAGAAGALVCVASLVWLPVYAPAWGLGSETAAQEVVSPAGPFDATADHGAPLRALMSALRADILDNPPSIFATEAESMKPGSGWSPSPGLTPGQPSAGFDQPPQPVPEPWSLALFLIGAAGLAVARGRQ